MFDTKRVPAAGWGEGKQKDAPDFETARLSFQAKKGYSLPAYLRTWLDGIVKVATERGRLGVVVWAEKGARDTDALVFMRLSDFRRLVPPADAPPSEPS
jgi:hypothetical protein